MKILIAPDKFKGTLTAKQVCEALAAGLSHQKHQIRQLPLADGGEGTQEFFLHHWKGTRMEVPVHDPLMRPIRAEYILSSDRKKAFVEMASASGLSLLKESERNAILTTTFGTGELVLHALNQGVEEVIIGIGGSATNDAGLGLLSAVGGRMLNSDGEEFLPRGGTLSQVHKIDLSLLHPKISNTKFTALCDVQNPFYGSEGAAFVYGPQKGATPQQVQLLDIGLQHVATIIKTMTGIDLQQVPGAGAGGGIAGGLHALLHAKLERGIDVVMDVVNFKDALNWADVVITGEGKVDEQTQQGKVVSGVIKRANNFNKRVILVCGQFTKTQFNCMSVYSLSEAFGMEEALKNPAKALTAMAGFILKEISQ